MAEMYYGLVINHKRTCNPENTSVKQVPATFKERVLVLLEEAGFDADGNLK